MNAETFKTLAEDYTAIPVYRRMLADTLTPVSLFLSIRSNSSHPFLFESVEGGEHLARYSFLGCNPYQTLTFDGESTWLDRKGMGPEKMEGSYFDTLESLTSAYTEPKMAHMPRLTGGAVGFSSYDTVRQIEALPQSQPAEEDVPEAIWSFYDEIYAFDHVRQQVVLIKTIFPEEHASLESAYREAMDSLDRMESKAKMQRAESGGFHLDSGALTSNMEESYFYSIVERAKKYIYEGDIFQVVLSQRFGVPFTGDPFTLYRALRMVNPSPYLFYLEFDGFSLSGSSPEVLVRVTGREARLLPIAGTRPRGATHEEDITLEKELLKDPKELAEHIMLVDLGRNDLSRVCETGSVRLERSQVIERFSHVMHIVSDVVGTLDPQMSSVDALKQCFPAGTVSGAPKIRALEIIDELEPDKRGVYAGAVGYFDFSGNMDTCIAIRTMMIVNNIVYIQAGAGIVADSDPEKEFDETWNKAGALVEALNVALQIAQ